MEIKCSFKEMVSVEKLVVNPRNTHKHNDKQVELLAKLIDFHGFRHPIIVSKKSGFICAGHGRLLAAKKLGLAEVPVDYQDFNNEAEEYAFLESDNRIQDLASYDNKLMLKNINELKIDDFKILGLDNFKIKVDDIKLNIDEKQEKKALPKCEACGQEIKE